MSQTDSTPVEDDEEEKKDTGRRAYFRERVGDADTFTGSFRGVPAHKHGGTQTVKPEDTIGNPDCWCGQVYGHDWPNKSRGAKHPRGDEMTAMADEKPYLNPRDLRAFDRKVVRALCELVNTFGVQYKISGNHVFLIAPHSTGQEIDERLKVSSSRQPENQVKFIERWAVKYVRPAVVEEAVEKLAEQFNDPTKKPHEKAPQKAATPSVAPTPTPKPTAPRGASSQAQETNMTEPEQVDVDNEAPSGYHQHHDSGRTEKETNWWASDTGKHYICKTCGYNHNGSGFAHQAKHNMTDAAKAERVRVSIATADRAVSGRKQRVRNAIKFLAEEYGIPLATDRDATKVQRLERELAAVTAQRDDYAARLELMREAMRA